ncbi:MAG TPA: hypothetical protein DCQ98_19040 [Planctomycetaceae bacterium]|nr:hypothetical protein [Planctomycetaceae bacterium]
MGLSCRFRTSRRTDPIFHAAPRRTFRRPDIGSGKVERAERLPHEAATRSIVRSTSRDVSFAVTIGASRSDSA